MYFDDVNEGMVNIFNSSAKATFGAISMLETQRQRMANVLLDSAAAMQKEGQKCVEQWVESTVKNQAALQNAYSNWVGSVTDLVLNGSGLQALFPQSPKKKAAK